MVTDTDFVLSADLVSTVSTLTTNLQSWYQRLRRPSLGAVDLIRALLSNGLGMLLAFVANIFIAHLLGPHDFGIYITLLSSALVMGGVAAYGVQPVLVREVAAQPSELRRAIVVAMSRWALHLTGLSSLGAMVLIAAWLTYGPGAPPSLWIERIAVIAVIPVSVWVAIATGLLGGLSQIAKSQAIVNVWKNGLLLLGASILMFASVRRIVDLLWLQVASFMIAALVGVYWVRWSVPEATTDAVKATITEGDTKSIHRAWQRSARNFFVLTAAVLVLGRADVIIVNAIAGPMQAGLFGAAMRLGQATGIAGIVWIAWLQPRVAHQFRQRQHDRLRATLRRGLTGTFSITLIIAVIGWVLAPTLMSLLGRGFTGATIPFRWLLICYMGWAVSVPYYVLLSMTNHERLVSRILWLQVILTLALSFPLARHFGALGGVWAWSLGVTVSSIMIIIFGLLEQPRGE